MNTPNTSTSPRPDDAKVREAIKATGDLSGQARREAIGNTVQGR